MQILKDFVLAAPTAFIVDLALQLMIDFTGS